MILKFKHIAIFTALLYLSLAAIFMFAPDFILSSWGVEFSPPVGSVARRVAALCAGLAVMFFLARNAEHSATRTALILGVITICMILAVLGVYELSIGNANRGILTAVLIEAVFGLAFLFVWRTSSKASNINSKLEKI